MNAERSFSPGACFADVCTAAGTILIAAESSKRDRIEVWQGDTIIQTLAGADGMALYPRMAQADPWAVAYQAGSYPVVAWPALAKPIVFRDDGMCACPQPVAVTWTGQWYLVAYLAGDREHPQQLIRRWLRPDGMQVSMALQPAATSQGIYRVDPDGSVLLNDAFLHHIDLLAQTYRATMSMPWQSDDGRMVIGQDNQTARALVCRDGDQSQAIIAFDGLAYSPRIVTVPGGYVAVCVGGPQVGVRVRALAEPYAFVPLGTIAPLGRKYLGWLKDDLTVDLPRNCTTRDLADGVGEVLTLDGEVLATFVGAGSADELHARAIVQSHRPVLGICDGFWPTAPIPGCDQLALELYPRRDTAETPDVIIDRVEKSLAAVPGPLWLIPKNYRNPGDTYPREHLSALTRAAADLARDPKVIGLLPFSGPARAGGIQDYPEVLAIQRQVFAAIEGPPVRNADPSPDGTSVDMLRFIVGDPGTWPRDGMDQSALDSKGRFAFVKQLDPPNGRLCEVFGVEGGFISLLYDRTDGQGRPPWRLRTSRGEAGAAWFVRTMRVGGSLTIGAQRWRFPEDRPPFDDGPSDYTSELYAHYAAYDCGGDIGVRPVIVTRWHLGDDYFEENWWADGFGRFRYCEYRRT